MESLPDVIMQGHFQVGVLLVGQTSVKVVFPHGLDLPAGHILFFFQAFDGSGQVSNGDGHGRETHTGSGAAGIFPFIMPDFPAACLAAHGQGQGIIGIIHAVGDQHDLISGEIQRVIVRSFNGIGRNQVDFPQTVEICSQAGCFIITLDETVGLDTAKADEPLFLDILRGNVVFLQDVQDRRSGLVRSAVHQLFGIVQVNGEVNLTGIVFFQGILCTEPHTGGGGKHDQNHRGDDADGSQTGTVPFHTEGHGGNGNEVLCFIIVAFV